MEFIPANSNNYKVGRDGRAIDMVIIHTVVGSLNSAVTVFQNPGRIASAHYIVGLQGRIVQMVKETDTAYHAGNWDVNLRSIGIEHEDNGDYNGPRTPTLYETSANLVADICKRYNIPIDRNHIKGHREVSIAGTACPDSLDVDRITNRAREIAFPPPPPVVVPPTPEWGLNLTDIVNKIKVLEKDVDLVNIETGVIVKTYPKGSTIEVSYETSQGGQKYYLTDFSATRRIPNGFKAEEFDYVAPPPPPVVEEPEIPTPPEPEPPVVVEPEVPGTPPVKPTKPQWFTIRPEDPPIIRWVKIVLNWILS